MIPQRHGRLVGGAMAIEGEFSGADNSRIAQVDDVRPAGLGERCEVTRTSIKRWAVVTVSFTDGTALSERVGAVRGTPENPMARAEVVAKARDLILPVLGEARGAALIAGCLEIEAMADVRALGALLRTG